MKTSARSRSGSKSPRPDASDDRGHANERVDDDNSRAKDGPQVKDERRSRSRSSGSDREDS